MMAGNILISNLRRYMKKLILFLMILASFTACQNDPITYPNFDYSSVYFGYQTPVRTITLGEDIYDNSSDILHKFSIYAVLAGVYENKHDVTINFGVADTICNGFNLVSQAITDRTAQNPVTLTPMPHDYYTLSSNQIIIKKGEIQGGVEIKLEDKFFNDPNSVNNTYVIPLLMTSKTNVDSMLVGKPVIAGSKPRLLLPKYWDVQPKNYVLYCVKYINPWHGFYLRRGVDVYSGTIVKTVVRHPVDVQTYDAVSDGTTLGTSKYLRLLTTTSMTGVQLPIVMKDATGTNYTCTLNLTFATDGTCTVTSSDPTVFTATGTGSFVKKGEKNSFDNLDRDRLSLDYTITHIAKGITTHTTDTLVMRNRGVVMEKYSVVAK